MSVSKKKYVKHQRNDIKIGAHLFGIVNEFTYLGSLLIYNNELKDKINRRINVVNIFYAFYQLLKAK